VLKQVSRISKPKLRPSSSKSSFSRVLANVAASALSDASVLNWLQLHKSGYSLKLKNNAVGNS